MKKSSILIYYSHIYILRASDCGILLEVEEDAEEKDADAHDSVWDEEEEAPAEGLNDGHGETSSDHLVKLDQRRSVPYVLALFWEGYVPVL